MLIPRFGDIESQVIHELIEFFVTFILAQILMWILIIFIQANELLILHKIDCKLSINQFQFLQIYPKKIDALSISERKLWQPFLEWFQWLDLLRKALLLIIEACILIVNYHCITLSIEHVRHLDLLHLQVLVQEKLLQFSLLDQYEERFA